MKNDNQSKLFQIQNRVSHKIITHNLKKVDFIKLSRLKIGHCLLTHKHIIERTAPPQCECSQQLATFHIFKECSLRVLREKRNKHKITGIQILSNENEFEKISYQHKYSQFDFKLEYNNKYRVGHLKF